MSTDDAFYGYLAGQFSDSDLLGQTDAAAAVDGISTETRAAYQEALSQGRAVLATSPLPWQRIGDYANRHFSNESEARHWLKQMLDLLEGALKKL